MSVEEHDTDNIGEGEVSESSIAALRAKLAQYAHSPSPRSRLSKPSSSITRASASPRKTPKKRKSSRSPSSEVPSPKKAKRGYAPPETYEHLTGVPDYLSMDLDVVFCGINPGYMSAETGHHFAHPSNRFWKCLHEGNLTPRRYSPTEDHTLPATCQIGITNLVPRPTAEAAELSTAELRAAVPALLHKLSTYQPRIVVFVGKVLWQPVLSHLLSRLPQSTGKRKAAPKSEFGLQPLKLVYSLKEDETPRETIIWVVPSTSGLCRISLPDMVGLFSGIRAVLQEVQDGSFASKHEHVQAVLVQADDVSANISSS